MKRLFIIRHAKSSWANPDLSDWDRPLNKRGLSDAPMMSKILKEKQTQLDVVYSSSAKRARLTAGYFVKAFDIAENKVNVEDRLYSILESELKTFIHSIPNDSNSVAIFGHNPTITDFINDYTDDFIENVPTCGITCIESSADSWSDFSESNAKLSYFIYPKMYKKEKV